LPCLQKRPLLWCPTLQKSKHNFDSHFSTVYHYLYSYPGDSQIPSHFPLCRHVGSCILVTGTLGWQRISEDMGTAGSPLTTCSTFCYWTAPVSPLQSVPLTLDHPPPSTPSLLPLPLSRCLPLSGKRKFLVSPQRKLHLPSGLISPPPGHSSQSLSFLLPHTTHWPLLYFWWSDLCYLFLLYIKCANICHLKTN
jgi:hypothetical protein